MKLISVGSELRVSFCAASVREEIEVIVKCWAFPYELSSVLGFTFVVVA